MEADEWISTWKKNQGMVEAPQTPNISELKKEKSIQSVKPVTTVKRKMQGDLIPTESDNADEEVHELLKWASERVQSIETSNPVAGFAIQTVSKWIRSGPDGFRKTIEEQVANPPKWEDFEPFVSPWLDPFPRPLEGVKSPVEVAGPSSRFARVLGVKLHYEQAIPSNGYTPGAPALVLIHGFNGCTFSWRHVLQPLADAVGSKVIAFDRPPFGLSERPTDWNGGVTQSPYSASAAANLTTALTRTLGLGKYVLVGHSAGAPIAASASTQSDRCVGLAMVAPAVTLPKEETTKQWPIPADNIGQILRIAYTSAIISVPGVGRSYIRKATERQVQDLEENGVGYPVPHDESPKAVAQGYLKPLGTKDWDVGIVEHYKALVTEGGLLAPGPTRASLPSKILIIQGGEDQTVPSWVAKTYAKAMGGESKGITYEEFSDVGHLPMEQDPLRFIKAMKDYVLSL